MAIKEKMTLRAPEGSPFLKVKLVRSVIGYPLGQRAVVKGLGLRKLNSEVVRPNTPEIRGMINKISHLLKVEALEEK
jgi:large subunit ribosomal protein L30